MLISLKKSLQMHWQQPKPVLSVLLTPLAGLYRFISHSRYLLYRYHLLTTKSHPLPVIVVGNLHAGGTGKTPNVIYLASKLLERGFKVGMISRGYGRTSKDTLTVRSDGIVQKFGDEPLLIVKKTGCPMVVSANRNQAIYQLTTEHPRLDLVISDDGLQHYQMERDFEIVVFPYRDLKRSLKTLPDGPLREPLSRLRSVKAIVISDTPDEPMSKDTIKQLLSCKHSQIFFAHTKISDFYPIHQENTKITADFFAQKQVVAACGIANPDRFIKQLTSLGIMLSELVTCPDHGVLDIAPLAKQYECVIITEKDAVKISNRSLSNVFVLPIHTEIEENFVEFIIDYLAKYSHRN